MAREKIKVKPKRRPMTKFDVFLYIFMALLAFVTAFPFYYLIIVSFSNYEVLHSGHMYLIPTVFDISAYEVILAQKQFWSSTGVTVFITVVGTFLGVITTTAAAYPLTKTNIPGNKFMMQFMIFTMFFGGGMIPSYLLVENVLHLHNSLWAMIWPVLIGQFNVILVKNFIEELPASIEESAKIDGANDVTILFKIVIPMSKPIIATIGLFIAVGKWNEYWLGMLYITDANKYPLQLLLRNMLMNTVNQLSGAAQAIASQNQTNLTMQLQMAVVTIATAPILLAYPFVQKYFTKGILLGGVKE